MLRFAMACNGSAQVILEAGQESNVSLVPGPGICRQGLRPDPPSFAAPIAPFRLRDEQENRAIQEGQMLRRGEGGVH